MPAPWVRTPPSTVDAADNGDFALHVVSLTEVCGSSGQTSTSPPAGSLWKRHIPPERNVEPVPNVSSMYCM
jgi:hypothetical protein